MDDDAFLCHVADRLGELPCVAAVTLGGSRAEGTHRPDSDWHFSIYYRGLTRAGLRRVDELVAAARPDEDALRDLVDRTSATCRDALREARGQPRPGDSDPPQAH